MSSNFPRRRQGIRLSDRDLVKFNYLKNMEGYPLVISPGVDDLNLANWAIAQKELIERELLKHGAILFRGFNSETAEHFSQVVNGLSNEVLEYKERAAARSQVAAKIYTSTAYPADQPIALHHEMSYSHSCPGKIWFYCRKPATKGGRAPIADDRKVIKMLSPTLKKRFLDKGVMYVKNYGEGLDLSWQEAFQTDDRQAVERYCQEANMQCEWRNGGRLRTRAVRHVTVSHPKLGTTVWFNHAHMFHLSNLMPKIREGLLAQFTENDVPRNAFFGDGSAIDDSIMEEVRETYNRAKVSFEWEQGDILLLDNILSSHGREPFEGSRDILVAMTERLRLNTSGSVSELFVTE